VADLSKDAITALVRAILQEELPVMAEQMLGRSIPELLGQIDQSSSIAHDAAVTRLGAVLGLKGKALTDAAKKLLEYNDSLPDEQKFGEDDDSIVAAWEKLNPGTAPSPAPTDVATTDKKGRALNEEGLPIFSRAELSTMLENDPAGFFNNPDVLAAYAENRVAME
jgi:hypothetical protein